MLNAKKKRDRFTHCHLTTHSSHNSKAEITAKICHLAPRGIASH